MAINPNARYPGQTTAPSADYPYGGARNQTVLGDGTGTPLEADLVNDLFGFQQALLEEAGITPSGDPETAQDSQYLDAMNALYRRRGEEFVLANTEVIESSGTYTVPAGVRLIRVFGMGGGGAGGGTGATTAGQIAVGGGGGSGGTFSWELEGDDIEPSYAVTIGAAGVPASGANGGSGGNTQFVGTVSAVGATAGGGSGGTAMTGGTSVAIANGGPPGTSSASSVLGVFRIAGSQTGGTGIRTGGTQSASAHSTGVGGFSSLGVSVRDAPASGRGAGGAGGFAFQSLSAGAGLDGAPGVVIVEEYV